MELAYILLKTFAIQIGSLTIWFWGMEKMAGQKRSRLPLVCFFIIRTVVGSVMMWLWHNEELAERIGDNNLTALDSLITIVNFIILMVLLLFTYYGGLLRISLATIIMELIASPFIALGLSACNWLSGSKNLMDYAGDNYLMLLVIVPVMHLTFWPVSKLLNPVFTRFRNVGIKHPLLLSVPVVAFLFYTILVNMQTYIPKDNSFIYILAGHYVVAVGLLIAACVSVFVYKGRLRKSKEYLLRAKANMEKQYVQLRQQTEGIERATHKLEQDMQRLEQMPKEDSGAVQEYLQELEQTYQQTVAGIYSDNFAVDSFLSYGKELCDKNGIKTDFSAQQCQKSDGWDERAEMLLLELFEIVFQYNLELPEGERFLKLHLASMKGRLLAQIEFPSRRKGVGRKLLRQMKLTGDMDKTAIAKQQYHYKGILLFPTTIS